MSETVPERLRRLVSSEICEAENTAEYASELRQFAQGVESEQYFRSKARFFKALGNPTRLKMVKMLAEREMCVCEVMVALDLTQPTASHHLNILEREGITKRRREGKWILYSISRQEIAELVDGSRQP